MPELQLKGPFFPGFAVSQGYADVTTNKIQEIVEKLLIQNTSADRPGMLLGKIQSRKTRTFMGVVALAFDNGFDGVVVLTKGTRALAKQTFERLKKEFCKFIERDELQVFDIMGLPPGLTQYELNQKLIFVVKKEDDNLAKLNTAIFES